MTHLIPVSALDDITPELALDIEKRPGQFLLFNPTPVDTTHGFAKLVTDTVGDVGGHQDYLVGPYHASFERYKRVVQLAVLPLLRNEHYSWGAKRALDMGFGLATAPECVALLQHHPDMLLPYNWAISMAQKSLGNLPNGSKLAPCVYTGGKQKYFGFRSYNTKQSSGVGIVVSRRPTKP